MRIIIPLGIVALGLMVYSFVECLQTPRERVRALGKWAWLAVIVLVPLIGAGLWLGFGRARRDSAQGGQRRPAAPDDDPNFLRGLEIQRRQRQRHEEERRRGSEGRQSSPAPSSESADEEPPSAGSSAGPEDGQGEDGENPLSAEQMDADHPGTAGTDRSDAGGQPGHTDPGPSGRTPGYRDDVDPDEELDPDDPRL